MRLQVKLIHKISLQAVTNLFFTKAYMKDTKTIQSYKSTASQKNRSTLDNSRSGFKDPIRVREQNPKDTPMEGKGVDWDFRQPPYDQKSSNFINIGTHYGVASKQPIGHKGDPKSVVDVMPLTRRKTMQYDDLG